MGDAVLHAEVLAVSGEEFLRYDGDVVFEKDDTLANAILEANPTFQRIYNEQTGLKLGMFHLENGTAEICTMMGQKEAFEV